MTDKTALLSSKQESNNLWDVLRALRDGMLDTVTLKRQQADEILRTNDLLQRSTCSASNELRALRAQLVEAASTMEFCAGRIRETLQRTADETSSCLHENFSEYASSPRICKDCGATLSPLLSINQGKREKSNDP